RPPQRSPLPGLTGSAPWAWSPGRAPRIGPSRRSCSGSRSSGGRDGGARRPVLGPFAAQIPTAFVGRLPVARPAVVIVGRPNVGKSALFNRLLGRRQAIVSDVPGVTRDRLEARCEWAGRDFVLVDTGGLVPGETEPLSVQVRQQAERAIHEAQAVLFVVDASTGMTAQDAEIAEVLRRSRHPVMVVANKVDSPALEPAVHEFHALGLGEPLPVSATHGLGTGDLLDAVAAIVPEGTDEADRSDAVRIAFLGRPNVGKSSLVNAIVGEKRVIVDP